MRFVEDTGSKLRSSQLLRSLSNSTVATLLKTLRRKRDLPAAISEVFDGGSFAISVKNSFV